MGTPLTRALLPGPQAGRLLPLLVFPALQAVAFALACAHIGGQPLALCGWLAVAAIALNFSVHIAVHECVHSGRSAMMAVASAPITVLIGMPFEGYCLHHHNHHAHDNGHDDYSCTWRATPAGPAGRNPMLYALGWPLQLARSMHGIRRAAARGLLPRSTRLLLAGQKLLLIGVLLALARWAPQVAIAYLAMIYLGWTLISLHNYGQHPPSPRAGGVAAISWHGRLYNRILANNGLHWEHHRAPAVPWHRLRPDPAAPRARVPHLLNVA